MLVTIQEIAEKAGVPVKTASRALSGQTMGKRRDARERAERVLKIAKELGYQPSNIAQSLRHGKTRTIGLVIGGLANNYFGHFVEYVLEELDKKGYRLLLEITKWDRNKEQECLRSLLRYRVDGIINFLDLPETLSNELKMIQDKEHPFLTLFPNEYGFRTVQSDVAQGIETALNHLTERGNNDIGIVFHAGQRFQRQQLTKWYKQKCNELNINGTVHCLDAFFTNMKEVVSSRHQAIIIEGPNILNHVVEGFQQQDKSYQPDIIGFYDEFNWHIRNECICGAVIKPTGRIIQKAVNRIIDWIEQDKMPEEAPVVLPTTFYKSEEFNQITIPKPSVINLSQL